MGAALAPPSPSVPRLMRVVANTNPCSPSSSQRGSGSVLSFFFPFPLLLEVTPPCYITSSQLWAEQGNLTFT